jgi:hypothetical protein
LASGAGLHVCDIDHMFRNWDRFEKKNELGRPLIFLKRLFNIASYGMLNGFMNSKFLKVFLRRVMVGWHSPAWTAYLLKEYVRREQCPEGWSADGFVYTTRCSATAWLNFNFFRENPNFPQSREISIFGQIWPSGGSR